MTFFPSRDPAKLKPAVATALISILLSVPAHADQWNLGLDNDVVIGDDGDFSNGIVIGWQTADEHDFSHAILPINWQSKLLFSQQEGRKQWGAKIYQRMWTPTEIGYDYAQPNERPYAGLLELESYTAAYSSQIAQKNWLSIGIMGPASGAQATQELVHKITSSTEPLGWKYQVENQFTLQFAYEADYLFTRQTAFENSDWELSGHSYSQLGNFRSETSLGMTLRWGDDLAQSFGQLSSHQGHYGQYSMSAKDSGSLTVFTRAQAGYRFNDLTLEGNLPYDSYVQLKNQQAQASVGAVWAFPNWSLSWRFDFYSKEYESDPQDWHAYGVLSYSWIM